MSMRRDYEKEDSGDGACELSRPSSGLSTANVVMWCRKVPLANSSRIGLSRRWTPLVYCADCFRPKRESMHGAPSENWRAPVLVRVAPGRREKTVALVEGA